MKPAAWRNKREPKLVRSEPPHPTYAHLWEPLYTEWQVKATDAEIHELKKLVSKQSHALWRLKEEALQKELGE